MVDRALGKGTLSSSSSSSGQIWFNNKQDATSFAQEGQKGGWSHHNQYGGGGRGKQKYRAGYGHYYGWHAPDLLTNVKLGAVVGTWVL